jgi:hypothetical protein
MNPGHAHSSENDIKKYAGQQHGLAAVLVRQRSPENGTDAEKDRKTTSGTEQCSCSLMDGSAGRYKSVDKGGNDAINATSIPSSVYLKAAWDCCG